MYMWSFVVFTYIARFLHDFLEMVLLFQVEKSPLSTLSTDVVVLLSLGHFWSYVQQSSSVGGSSLHTSYTIAAEEAQTYMYLIILSYSISCAIRFTFLAALEGEVNNGALVWIGLGTSHWTKPGILLSALSELLLFRVSLIEL